MKLKVNFDALLSCVEQMGTDKIVPITFTPINKPIPVEPKEPEIYEPVTIGVDVYIDKGIWRRRLPNGDKVHVVLYIADHSRYVKSRSANSKIITVDDIEKNPSLGNKYHLTDCDKINKMKEENRFHRYMADNNSSGFFKIFDCYGEEKPVRLNVCKYCLKKLNYKNYNSNRDSVFNNFNLEEFFNYYVPLFQKLPNNVGQDKAGYAEDWAEISKRYRASQKWCCEECGVNLVNDPDLLQVHHKNGVKQDNSNGNLKALCKECHQKQDYHEHLLVSSRDLKRLIMLRSQQSILQY